MSLADYDLLRIALREVELPRNSFDFTTQVVSRHTDHTEIEDSVRFQLLAKDPEKVLEGLSNVLYWVSQRGNIGQEDIYHFRSAVRKWMLVDAIRLFDWIDGPGLVRIGSLKLPGFNNLFSASALRCFLDPWNTVSLSPEMMKLRELKERNLFKEIRGEADGWPLSVQAEGCYERWCRVCRKLAHQLAGDTGVLRPCDVERALDWMMRKGDVQAVLHLVIDGDLGRVLY